MSAAWAAPATANSSRPAARRIIAPRLHEALVAVREARDDQHQRQQHQQRGDGVHLRRHRDLDHRVDLQRQGRDADAGGEEGDDEIVDREREGHQEAGHHRRQDQRKGHQAEGLPRRGAEVARRLEDALVHAGQAGAHDDGDEADGEGDVGERRPTACPGSGRSTWLKNSSSDTPSRISGIATGVITRNGSQRRLVAVHGEAGHGAEHGGA